MNDFLSDIGVFGVLSFLIFVASCVAAWFLSRMQNKEKRILSTFNKFTAGIFVAIAVFHIPAAYTYLNIADYNVASKLWNTVVMAVFNAIRVFIAEGDYESLYNSITKPEMGALAEHLLIIYAVILLVFAPVLTFGTVLSFFGNLRSEWRYWWHKRRPHYIMSELNERSIALAESIYKSETIKNPVIVFSDVFERDEEEDYDLLLRARAVNAILFKKDVSNINLKNKKYCNVEIFLMSDDESENIAQAIELTENNKKNPRIAIYLCSASENAGCIIDSLDKGNCTLSKKLTDGITKEPEKYVYDIDFRKEKMPINDGFYIRRLDNINLLAMRTLSDDKLMREVFLDKVCYIMSEYNAHSIALSEMILKEYNEYRLKIRPAIVFAGLPDEKDTEKMSDDEKKKTEELKAKIKKEAMAKFGAKCCDGDVAVAKIKGSGEVKRKYFLVGDSPEKNADAAKALSQKDENNGAEIYICADRSDDKAYKKMPENVKILSKEESLLPKKLYEEEQPKAKTEAKEETAVKKEKIISILILGMGSYGMEFFKTAVWLYQAEGYKLEFNIFDSSKSSSGDGENDIVKQLKHECPEIISKKEIYDIKFFTGVDCFSSDFDDIIDKEDVRERLKQTKLAIVSLGDDDRNIEAAIMLRRVFDRINGQGTMESDEVPAIFSIVFDDKKASNLGSQSKEQLKNYKSNPYNIRLIGNLSSQYSYDVIEEMKEIESEAFAYHFDWLRKQNKLHREYEKDEEFRKIIDSYYPVDPKNPDDPWRIPWYDDAINFSEADDKKTREKRINDIIGEAKKYVDYEYFRNSSISKAMHKKLTRIIFEDASLKKYDSKEKEELKKKGVVLHEDADTCMCDICEMKRRTEHDRWNAYMRVNGYVYNKKRCDRAKLHDDLVEWEDVKILERYKD